MELREAVSQLTTIQTHLARTQIFDGYRAFPVALTGVAALFAGALQSRWVPQPQQHVQSYALYWSTIAAISLALCLTAMLVRYYRRPSSLLRAGTLAALQQLAPAILVGLVATLAIVRSGPQHGALLPGLWQLFMSLGVFASLPQLPRPSILVGCIYLLSGALVVVLSNLGWAFSPWLMSVPFCIGQSTAAAILYWTLEHGDVK